MKEKEERKLSGVMGGCAAVFLLIGLGLFFLMLFAGLGRILIAPLIPIPLLIALLAGIAALIFRYSEQNRA